jgi:hypothetical protein
MTPRVDALEASPEFQWRNGESTVQFLQRQLDAMTALARELEADLLTKSRH